MSEKQKKKKKGLLQSRFFHVYIRVLMVALILILIGTVWLMSYLRDLESAEPIYVARDVAALFEKGDFENLYRMDSSAGVIAGGDRDFYLENMRKVSAGKTVDWAEVFTEDPDEHRYIVTLDGDRFASFVLVPNGRTNRRGHKLWTLGRLQTHVAVETPPEPEPTPEPPAAVTACRVTAPAGYIVTVDGVTLSQDNAALTENPLYEEGFLPPEVENPVMVTYDYSATSENPQVTVTDAGGVPATISQTGENAWSCALREDEMLKAQYSEAAYKLAQKIARFTSRDGSKGSILGYCAPDSPARNTFNNLSNQYATPHNGVNFQNPVVAEFYALGDRCFTCRVSFDYQLKTRDGIRTDPTAYTFCIITQGNDVKLYNLLMG